MIVVIDMKKKKNKLVKRRIIVFGSISIIAVVYFILSLVTYTTDIKRLKQEEIDLNNKLSSLKENAEELKIEIEKLKDPEYIARFAREEFSYSKEKGEYVIKIEEKEKVIVEETIESNSTYKYIIFGIGFILICIIIYIIKK